MAMGIKRKVKRLVMSFVIIDIVAFEDDNIKKVFLQIGLKKEISYGKRFLIINENPSSQQFPLSPRRFGSCLFQYC